MSLASLLPGSIGEVGSVSQWPKWWRGRGTPSQDQDQDQRAECQHVRKLEQRFTKQQGALAAKYHHLDTHFDSTLVTTRHVGSLRPAEPILAV